MARATRASRVTTGVYETVFRSSQVPMLAPQARQVGGFNPELAPDPTDFVALLRANPRVGRRQREETLEEVKALLVRRVALELARHEKVVRRAEQALLARRHLDDERGLIGRQFAFFLHQ